MKYIRTEDGIFTLITKDDSIFELNGKKYYCVEERISSFEESKIIKQADTIEELCDEFVFLNKVEGLVDKTHVITFENMPNHHFTEPTTAEKMNYIYKRYDDDDLENIYGAIWTDKGLIFVAKMNDKGELELL